MTAGIGQPFAYDALADAVRAWMGVYAGYWAYVGEIVDFINVVFAVDATVRGELGPFGWFLPGGLGGGAAGRRSLRQVGIFLFLLLILLLLFLLFARLLFFLLLNPFRHLHLTFF
jgi:hypothetical protein